MPSLSQQLARFVAQLDYDKLPPDVIEKARVCLLNAYGMALGGRDTAFAPVARNTALAMEGEVTRGATLLGDGRRTTIGGACLANAALFHGRCQEDTLGAAHFGTVLIPLLTALLGMGLVRLLWRRRWMRIASAATLAWRGLALLRRFLRTRH